MAKSDSERSKAYRARKRDDRSKNAPNRDAPGIEEKQEVSQNVTRDGLEKHGGETFVTFRDARSEFEPWTVACGVIGRPGEGLTLVDIKRRYAALKAAGRVSRGMVSVRYPHDPGTLEDRIGLERAAREVDLRKAQVLGRS